MKIAVLCKYGILLTVAIMAANCSPPPHLDSADFINSSSEDDCPFTIPYRAWFFNPPPNSVTGYPREGVTAKQDAIVRIKGYKMMFVKGMFKCYREGSYHNKQDSISFYYDETDTLSAGKFYPVDSFYICCNGKIWLMSSAPEKTIDTTNAPGCRTQEGQPVDTAFLYGKGTCKLYRYAQAMSWIKAEEAAIKTLCQQSIIRYASMRKKLITGDFEERSNTVEYEMNLTVHNTKIITRYYDKANNRCTVVVACRKTDISPLKEKQND
jgi:hypothetical protein